MVSNLDIFFNFLGKNFQLENYIKAYRKRYNSMDSFLTIIGSKAKTKPNGLFKDILGTGHGFKKLEERWIEYVDKTINYTPKCGEKVYCCYIDDECTKVEWLTEFLEGTKECFTDMGGNINNKQTFVSKI